MTNENTVPDTPTREYPATEAQKEIWISSKMGHDASCAYNESFQIDINGTCSIEYLQKTITTIVTRHDALNAVFSDDGMWMRLRNNTEGNVPVVDISGMPSSERVESIKQLAVREVSESFDLTHGPLWRAIIAVLSPNEIRLFFTAHHIICDGWSVNLIVNEILATYSAYLQKKELPETRSSSFGEYLIERNRFLPTPQAQDHKQYWKNKFSQPIPSLELPTDKPRPSHRTYAAAGLSIEIPVPLFSVIKKTAISLQCNPFAIFLGAYAILLYKLSGNSPVVIGVPVSGQSFTDNKDLVGHCVNMLPVKCTVNPAESFSGFIGNLQDALYDDFDHYTLTFGELVKVLNIIGGG